MRANHTSLIGMTWKSPSQGFDKGVRRFNQFHGQQLEIILAKEVGVSDADRGFASLNYHSAGHRKWRNEIQFVRDRLVKTGQLSNAVRGRWTVTEAGHRRVGMAKPAVVR